jgi:hypothetical protein
VKLTRLGISPTGHAVKSNPVGDLPRPGRTHRCRPAGTEER